MVGSGVFLLEFAVSILVKDNPAIVLLYECHQCRLVDMDPSLVGLFDFRKAHVLQHGPDTFPHTIITVPDTTAPRLAVPSHNINGLDSCQLGRVDKVRHEAFFEPPSQGDFSTAQRQKVQIQLEPLRAESRDACVKASLDAFLEEFSAESNLGGYRIEDSVVAHHVLYDTGLVHFLKELEALFPQIAPCTSRNGGIVNVNVWGDTLHLHAVH